VRFGMAGELLIRAPQKKRRTARRTMDSGGARRVRDACNEEEHTRMGKMLLQRTVIAFGVLLVLVPSVASAQDTSTGTLTVTATVASSIGLTFENDGAGVALTGAGTNAATMGLGTISAYGTIATAGVTRTRTASDFTVSSPFGVKVIGANSSSADYTLAVALGSADATNTWKINATTLTTSNQNLGTAYSYGGSVAHTMYLTVPFSASTGAISKVLNFTATAN
jgi:hypothetical protein